MFTMSQISRPVLLLSLRHFLHRQFSLHFAQTRNAEHCTESLLKLVLQRGRKVHCPNNKATIVLIPKRYFIEHIFIPLFRKRTPLEHLTQRVFFYGRNFVVSPSVLICRQDSEVLIDCIKDNVSCPAKKDIALHDQILRDYVQTNLVERNPALCESTLPKVRSILDLCTGSGCLLITSLLELESSGSCHIERAIGVDISQNALRIARENQRKHLSSHSQTKVSWIQADLFSFLRDDQSKQVVGKVDCIISNPPYIATKDLASLDIEVREHEPEIALHGGYSGLIFYELLAQEAHRFLTQYGVLVLEHGYDQKESIHALFERSGHWRWIESRKDWSSNDRVLLFALK